MKSRHLCCLLSVFVVTALPTAIVAQDEIAVAAKEMLKQRCGDCHGTTEQASGTLNFDDYSSLIAKNPDSDPYLSPGQPDQSEIYLRVTNIDDGLRMPPDEPLTLQEHNLLRKWILDGAADAETGSSSRPFVSEEDILLSIEDFLRNRRRFPTQERKKFYRFFSLAHMHNNPNITERELRYTRAALSKVINSTSRADEIVLPEAIDEHQTVYAVNIAQLEWTVDHMTPWRTVLNHYPYGYVFRDSYRIFQRIMEESGRGGGLADDQISYIRADWFVFAASQPPIYHHLTGMPDNLSDLLKLQEVEVHKPHSRYLDGLNPQLHRGAVLRSGVSAQNRLLDRFVDKNKAGFWVSYDFAKNHGRNNIVVFPLGPAALKDPQPDQKVMRPQEAFSPHAAAAFREAGSELIWELPNGMHAYMIVDGEGRRIDRAPTTIVWNKAVRGGNDPVVVNGVSCMQCHTHGIKEFVDDLKHCHALEDPEPSEFLAAITPDQDEWSELFRGDRNRYLRTMEEAIGGFLQVGDDEDKDIEEFSEPVSLIVDRYSSPLTLVDVACEINWDPAAVTGLRSQRTLRKMGLETLKKNGGVVQRTYWAPPKDVDPNSPFFGEQGVSIYRRAIRVLDL